MKFWEDLSAKNRRYAVLGAAAAVFSIVVAILPTGGERERAVKEEPAIRAVLTDRESGDARFERLMAQMENIRDDSRETKKEIERFRRDMERLQAGEIGETLNKELRKMDEKLKVLEKNAELGPSENNSETHVVIGGKDEAKKKEETAAPVAPVAPLVAEPGRPSQVQMWDQPTAPAPAEEKRSRKSDEADVAKSSIRVIEAPKKELTEAEKEAQKEDEGIYIPAGSIITGTLITGMDAPTGKQARQEPHPALLRIKHEAILPNRFRADVRECFALLGGYGDLSSERAYLRGETISCVRKDGQVVESKLNSFTVGEDGKAGVRGRLVSKQGQMLTKALAAGMVEGFAQAFDRVPVPTLSLERSEQQLYQQAFSQDAMQSGAVSGMGKALDRLAQFYIDQAEGMFPVIEIDAGREVEIVMINGGKLALK